MPARSDEETDSDPPSKLALQNAREIGQLSEVTKALANDVGAISREMKEGFNDMHRIVERMGDKINRPPNMNLYIGLAGLMLAGVPIIAALIYFTVTSTTAPLIERLGKVEQSVETSRQHEWDNFELMVRSDQVLLDRGLKTNETDTAIKVEQNKLKHPKKSKP